MNWLEAVAAMKEGTSIRRKDWDNTTITMAVNGYVRWGNAPAMGFYGTVEDYEATDWEVVSEPPRTKKVTYYKAYYKYRDHPWITETSWEPDRDKLIVDYCDVIEIEEREFEVPCE
jgi:hypothetical protein